MNLNPAELRQLADLLERLEPSAKPPLKQGPLSGQHATPTTKRKQQRKAPTHKAKAAPVVAPASANTKAKANTPHPPASADDDAATLEAKRAKRRIWAKAARDRKRAKREAAVAQEGRRHNLAQTKRARFSRAVDAANGIPHPPSPELQASANEFTDRELAAATGFSQTVCRDLQLGRACHAGVLSRISEGIARLREVKQLDEAAE
jgi:hypothetical protein